MSITVTRSGSVVKASLAGELRVSDATTLYREIFSELDEQTSLVVDVSGVTRLDASIVQIFFFASRRVRELRVEKSSAAWEEAWTVLGLQLPARAPQ